MLGYRLSNPFVDAEPNSVIPAAIAIAQMRRDREALARAQAQIADLRTSLEYWQNLSPYRAYALAKRAYQRLPSSLRARLRRAWARRSEAELAGPASAPTSRRSRGRALVIDD